MLNKIENINLKPDLRSDVKASKGDSALNKVYKKEGFADTLTYSSALIFISLLNWKLKKLNVNSDNLIEIEFNYENYSFFLLINQKSPALKDVYLKVSDFNAAAYSKVSRFVLEANFNYLLTTSEPINYEVLTTVFSRIKSFFISGEDQISSIYYQNIFKGLEDKLVILFSQIYFNVIEFIEKLNNKKFVMGSEELQGIYGSNLTIKGIHVEYY